MDKNIGVVVLCGGLSSRMGQCKAELMSREQYPFFYSICERMSIFKHKYLSLNSSQKFYFDGFVSVYDEYEQIGPMGGICSALRVTDCNALLAIACDMPMYSMYAASEIVSKYDGEDVLYPLAFGKREPLAAIYSKNILPLMETLIKSGSYRLGELIDNSHSNCFASEFEQCFMNINTLEEYSKYLKNINL